MIDVRMINETQCARLAAARADNEHIEKLSTVIGRAKTAIDRRDVHALMTLDREFHLVLATASRNLELAEIVRKLNERSLSRPQTTITSSSGSTKRCTKPFANVMAMRRNTR